MDAKINFDAMRRLGAEIRIETIKAITDAGFGHIGGSMSAADVLAVLYGGVMNIRPQSPGWENRDWFVLSKGHCGPVLYATLAIKGYFPKEILSTINRPGTSLPSHCDRQKTPGIDMTTGSLGQGFSAAVGIAFGNRAKGKQSYTYCVVGDGECQEGQIWEGAQFAAQHKLDRFITFIDANKKQLDGTLESINSPLDFSEKFRSFGWHAQNAVGYDVEGIYAAIEAAKEARGKPSVIVLHTYKGIGCNFAEREAFNHYMVVNRQMCDEAIAEIRLRLDSGSNPGGDLSWAN